MSGHTPGEWKVTKDERGLIVRVVDGHEQPIASIWMNGDDMEANARLIAAAPAMYEALQLISRGLARGKIKDATLMPKAPPGATECDLIPLSKYIDDTLALASPQTSEG